MTERRTNLWVHGFGVHPTQEKLALAAQSVADEGLDARLIVPELTDRRGNMLVVPPLAVQAERLAPHLNSGLDHIVTHSQGIFVLAQVALRMAGAGIVPQLTVLAPPLTSPAERLLVPASLREASAKDDEAAAEYGGAHGAIRWQDRNGAMRSVVLSNAYAEEIGDPHFEAYDLVEDTLHTFSQSVRPRVIRPDKDERFGDLDAEYEGLRHAFPGVSFETMPQSGGHNFKRRERDVARAALLGIALEPHRASD